MFKIIYKYNVYLKENIIIFIDILSHIKIIIAEINIMKSIEFWYLTSYKIIEKWETITVLIKKIVIKKYV